MQEQEEFKKYLKSYRSHSFLITEGEEDTDFYCLLQGTVGIWKGDPLKKESLVKIGEISEKGTFFGEMSCLLDEARTASIIAGDEPVKVLKFPGEMLSQLMLKYSKLGVKICTALANRLLGTTARQQDIAIERNEIRDDATNQFLYAREAFQRVFMMLTAIQTRLQHPDLKSVIEHMSCDKLLQGGRKIKVDEAFLEEIPAPLVDQVKQAYQSML